jgi:hypothetical protein
LLKESDIIRVCEYAYSYHDDSSGADLSQDTAYVKPKPHGPIAATANIDIPATGALIDDDSERSSIIHRIDARSGSGVRLSVKPEVKLRAILEIGKHLSNVLNIDDVLPSILDALFQIFPQADQAFVLLKDEEEDEPQVRACRNRRTDDDSMLQRSARWRSKTRTCITRCCSDATWSVILKSPCRCRSAFCPTSLLK